ncbi:MAG: hypothetical protein ABWZ88_01350 [Variovorax sp.]
MTFTIPYSSCAAALAVAVLATACSTKAPAPAVATAPAPEPAPVAPPPPPPAAPAGIGYDQLAGMLDGSERQVKQDVMNKLVTLNLSKASGRDVPAGTYTAGTGDATYFRCRVTARGFTGGEVTTQVKDYRFVTKGKQKIVDLDRCAVAEPPVRTAAAPVAPAAAVAAPAPTPAPAPVAGGPAKPGMDARGNVIDSSKVESGSGRTVKGLNDYEGEITGNMAPNSKFAKLQIGMPVRQVTDLTGPPTDQGAYMTGKAWIPFYFGADRHRFEMTYKGQGRLIFAGGGMGDFSNGYLIWIINNPNEPGYR